MELDHALEWVAQRNHGILITIRRDGRPQSSDISFTLKEGKFCISATSSRAKTKNLLKDNRAVLHVTSPESWSYVSFDGTVEVSPPAQTHNDTVNQELAEIYKRILGKDHPNWEEYHQAMIDDERLILRFIPKSAVGMVN